MGSPDRLAVAGISIGVVVRGRARKAGAASSSYGSVSAASAEAAACRRDACRLHGCGFLARPLEEHGAQPELRPEAVALLVREGARLRFRSGETAMSVIRRIRTMIPVILECDEWAGAGRALGRGSRLVDHEGNDTRAGGLRAGRTATASWVRLAPEGPARSSGVIIAVPRSYWGSNDAPHAYRTTPLSGLRTRCRGRRGDARRCVWKRRGHARIDGEWHGLGGAAGNGIACPVRLSRGIGHAGASATATPAPTLLPAVPITLNAVVTGLPNLIGMSSAPGDPRLFVIEQQGRIVIVSGGRSPAPSWTSRRGSRSAASAASSAWPSIRSTPPTDASSSATRIPRAT